jgi:hypothetical protein
MSTYTISLSAAISTNRDSWTLTDDSTFTSPVRSAYRIYVNAYKVDYQNAKTALTVDSYTPTSATEYTIEYTIDGHYQIEYAAFQAWSSGTTYAQYDAVYVGPTVYRSLVGSNLNNLVTDTAYWEVISDPATLAANTGETNESANIDSLVYDRVFAANSQYTYGNFIAEASVCTDCDQAQILQKYNTFSLLLRELEVADQRTSVVDGETVARKIQSLYIDC